jgi:hypothetical protein
VGIYTEHLGGLVTGLAFLMLRNSFLSSSSRIVILRGTHALLRFCGELFL